MSWVFLAVSVVGLLLALNVRRPVFAPPLASVVSFFAGWLVGELPIHSIAWLAGTAAVFAYAGVGGGPPAIVAYAMILTACVVLATVAVGRSARARLVFDRALVEGLGASHAESITDAARAWLAPALDWWRLALPFPVRHGAVVCRRRIAFYREEGASLLLDVHRSRDASPGDRRPTLVYVHGGGWILGHRERQGLPLLQHLAARGWVCFSVDYRLSPAATFPDHLVDVKRAIAWVREHAAEYGADPGFVAVAGNSAGGHLAALAALTPGDPEYQPGFESADTSVSACIGLYGVYDFLDRHGHWPHQGMRRLLERHVMKATRAAARAAFEKASPIDRVRADAPPFLLVHGDNDTLSPVGEARRFYEALRATSRGPVAYAEIPGAQHAFEIFPSLRTAHALDGMTRFLAYVYSARGLVRNAPVEDGGVRREGLGVVVSPLGAHRGEGHLGVGGRA
jgi:acetyl esterase/lipase